MPATTTLSSPPACVNSTIRRRPAAIQSIVSVPESIAIFAPAESANHSSGTPSSLGQIDRGDDPPALGLGQRSERARRIAEQDHPEHPLGIALGEVPDRADDDAGRVRRRWALDRLEPAVVAQLVLDELAGRLTGGGMRGREQLDDLGRVEGAAATGGADAPRSLVERAERLGRRVLHLDRDVVPGRGRRSAGSASRTTPSRSRSRPWIATSSIPRPIVRGATRSTSARISSGASSMTGHACSTTRFHIRRRCSGRRAWKPRIASSTDTSTRSSSGRPTIAPAVRRGPR